MSGPRHERPAEIAGLTLEQMIQKYTARFDKLEPDWDAFADSRMEGRKRAQHRFIGAGGSGKHNDGTFIPAGGFTLSVMLIPPGNGGSAHTHEIEEAFFVLDGVLTVFFQDETGRQVSTKLGKWECISCPPGVPHGFMNEGPAPVYVQTLIGKGRPGPVGYVDDKVYDHELKRTAAMT
jgi:mannose-6-phosphate isomerase-like protein (cupin superfamily)